MNCNNNTLEKDISDPLNTNGDDDVDADLEEELKFQNSLISNYQPPLHIEKKLTNTNLDHKPLHKNTHPASHVTNAEEISISQESQQENDYHSLDYFPDGGFKAWTQLFGGFLTVFLTWGIATSFGVFTVYYKNELLPDTSSFHIGWISSVQSAFIFYGGSLTGKLFDAGYFYHLEISGAVTCVACFMLIAECTEYYQILLAQGVGMGLGMGVMFGPALACTGAYFKKRRPLVMAVCSSGCGFGGMIFPIITNNLLYSVGFKWTLRILGFVDLTLLAVVIGIMRDRIPRRVRQEHLAASLAATGKSSSFFSLNAWIDVSALRDPVFMLFAFGVSFCFLVTYAPYAFLQSFAIKVNASDALVKYIIALLGGISFFGRISTYIFAKWFGPLNCLGIFAFLASITLYAWPSITSEPQLIIFAIAYGFLSGIIATFPPFVVPILTTDITRLGVRFGMAFLGLGTGCLLSIPMAGLVLGSEYDRYMQLAMFCGTGMMIATILLAACRVARAGFALGKI